MNFHRVTQNQTSEMKLEFAWTLSGKVVNTFLESGSLKQLLGSEDAECALKLSTALSILL